ncbi:cation-translocating P-type ATPase [Microbacterium album]|uniref:ATPase n=1 Tax=Microbacterium album TaxID=2053191 RepID=A0A917ID29_9MICO|nr:HAD-IC family P-type ATPase [Microbacterium album]GGH36151.1 ATPase [Microbacterium album]
MTKTSTSPAWHALPAEDALARLSSSEAGLEPVDVEERLERFGRNTLPTAPPTPWWRVLARQFVSPLIAILSVAAVITAFQRHWVDTGAIVIVLILNGALGFWQERKAERDVRALQSLAGDTAHVRRSGATTVVPSAELVPGDIVLLESGERVPADLRLLEANALLVDESMFTGETVPVHKSAPAVAADAAIAEKRSMAFSGTLVTSGRGVGLVVATGLDTELGEITELTRGPAPTTPLQLLTHSLERRIGIAVLVAVAFVFATGLVTGYSLEDMFRVGVALVVASIPESLPIILTVAMSVGVSRMARRGAIVRTLPSVETLGSTTVIASDKTGTLTQNRLTVEQLWTLDDEGPADRCTGPVARELLRGGALTNEASPGADGVLHGDAVDVAMATVALDAEAVSPRERAAPPVAHMPYEPALRYSQTVVRDADGRRVLYVKGSPDVVAGMSDRIATAEGPIPLDPEILGAVNERFATGGLRVIAVASRVLDADTPIAEPLPAPSGLILQGLQAMTDPPREGVAEAVANCRRAGIAVKMVTGDHPTTAEAIAHRLGIDTGGRALTGAEMATLDDRMLAARLEETGVAARVAPRDKLRIVKALQGRGEVVAVTGDGVNDAPALKSASIGVAMGASGTDAAREAADIVLTDDNFVTIVDAVEQGRVTFAAIRKATFFLLSTAVAGLLCISLNVLLEQPLLFLPVQILWINLVTSGIQDIALALEPAEGDELRRPPRARTEGILSRVLWFRTVITGIWMGLIVLLVFDWALRNDYPLDHARSLAMAVFVLLNFFQVGNARAEHRSLLFLNPFRNKVLLATSIGAIVLLWAVMAWPPAAGLLGLTSLAPVEWAVLALIASSVLVLVEADKLIRRLAARRRVRTRPAGARA